MSPIAVQLAGELARTYRDKRVVLCTPKDQLLPECPPEVQQLSIDSCYRVDLILGGSRGG